MSDYLATVVANLGQRRQVLSVAACEQRDRLAAEGDHAMAAVWNAVACAAADSMAAERALLRVMEDDLSPVLRPLTAEELAGSRFDDEEPSC